MYLKKLIAHGFKSFADNIVIDFNNDISGVVGPNGSGKSNIVDAVRWVLGEQSVKSLRGDSMTDVIFAGSKSRGGMNAATVTLIFDNSDNYLPLSFDEVSIKRRLYKDGTNEYFLNGEKVRLKDITEILMDSGIAKESFNIISQGKIEEILSSKPESRRVIFEEAAGIIKYRKRKEEALRKLDRTHLNMDRINDIISELEVQIEPLKEQKERALEYQDISETLKRLEISLAVLDITNINDVYQDTKDKIELLKNEITSITTSNSNIEAKSLELKVKINKKDNELRELNSKLLSITEEVEKINSKKNILLERKKYQVDNVKLHNNIIALKEEEASIGNDKNNILREIEAKVTGYNKINDKIKLENTEYDKVKNNKNTLISNLNNLVRNDNKLKQEIEVLRNSIDNNSSMPYAVKSVLNNPKLRGIHDTVGNIIEVEEEYSKAISIALSSSTSSIIVDNEQYAKDAINYLKENKIGRATFLPLNNIKPKYINDNIKDIINIEGLVGTSDSLVKYDPKYTNIIKNLLGNVIVVNNIDTANKLSRMIHFSNRIVTLDGDVINVGGSLTGGNIKIRNVILDKYKLESKIKEENSILTNIKKIEDDINNIDNTIRAFEDKLYLLNKDKIVITDEINSKKIQLNNLEDKLTKIKNELHGTNNIINDALSVEEEQIINEYYKAVNTKDEIINKIDILNNEKKELQDILDDFETSLKKENSTYATKSEELKNLEILVNRYDVKLDNLLNTLNEEYTITYEKAKSIYMLDIDESEARSKVNSLKRKIKNLGIVNLGAIEEYDRISERYEFLINQQNDLVNAENTLLTIIDDMDKIMEKEFLDTFNIISKNFEETFKELFRGGTAKLELTDKNNLLETGIDIIASPPGKTLKNISLLSGGEKTFTAISLLFAILKSRSMPFCILDEVEAALDEVNVAAFGEYLLKLKEKTQFIVITHKKKTMEYANVLYGITMQESGISKLVSVKLEDIKETK